MNTGYYAKHSKKAGTVAISATVPAFYKGRRYKKLAPSWSIFNEWQKFKDDALFTRRFMHEILTPLDPQEVFNELGENAILLCYETPEKFCHRHIVASWLSQKLHYQVVELE